MLRSLNARSAHITLLFGVGMWIACAGAVLGVLPSSASAAVVRVATLTAPQAVYGTVVSGGTAVADAGSANYVFTERGDGWSSEAPSAKLVNPGGVGAAEAVSGDTVLTDGGSVNGSAIDALVFVRPVGGWSGVLNPSSTLVASDGASLGAGDIAGRTVAAEGSTPGATAGSIYVFSEPQGGWTGSVSESAKLIDAGGLSLGSPTISGGHVFALASSTQTCCQRQVDVFSEPAGGWSGTVKPSATLVLGRSYLASAPRVGFEESGLAVDGRTVLSDGVLWREPRRGWSGKIDPVGSLYLNGSGPADARLQLSGGLAGGSAQEEGPGHECPCTDPVWLLSEPRGGWSGTIAAPVAFTGSTANGAYSVALQDPYGFSADGSDSVQVFTVSGTYGRRVTAPRVVSIARGGFLTGRPSVSFRLRRAASYFPGLDRITISAPRGLRFATNREQLLRAISVSGAGMYVITTHASSLSVTLSNPVAGISVALRPGSLTEAAGLRREANASTRAGRRSSGTFQLGIWDSTGERFSGALRVSYR